MSNIDNQEKLSAEYLSSVFTAPLLEINQEKELLKAWQDSKDVKALSKIILAHARLAVSIASEFRKYGLPASDLIQEGNVGLMEAAHRFDCSRGVRFSTYAMWWIRAQIQHFILNNNNQSSVRFVTTNDRKKLFFRLNAIRSRFGIDPSSRLSRESAREIAVLLNVSEKDVEMMDNRLSAKDSSLNETVRVDNTMEFQDTLVDERPNPEQCAIASLDQERSRRIIREALTQLSARERRIISARKMSDEPLTLEELSAEFGVSRERVRQIEKKGMERLRVFLDSHFKSEDLVSAG